MIFNINDVKKILDDFAINKRMFLTEAQFQFELAWEIKSRFNHLIVHLEYPCENSFTNSRYYYDIVIQEDNEFYVLELKYKTKQASINYKGSSYMLKNHAAQDLGRFDYLQDVSRIECWRVNNNGKHFAGGCAIILTNDSSYWKKTGVNCIYQDFALLDGITIPAGKKSWNKNVKSTSVGARRINGLDFKNGYLVNWKDYTQGFKYLITEIK